MRRILTISILCVITGFSFAQPAPVVENLAVTVVNDQQQVLADATVELLRSSDSSLVKAALTDSNGVAVFTQLNAGTYLLHITSVNYSGQYIGGIQWPLNSGENMPKVVLFRNNASLQGVTVTARKPFIQQLPGKTVINVEAAITNAGTTALEVLEKSPGVTVDKDGNISLKGRSGILVMIDNKPAYISGTDLVNMLGSMSSNQIDVIELITNPGAQYDAAGNAGIINIKTKKTKQRGFNGTINTSYGQGRYYKSNNSLMMNYRNGNWNLFLNYSMNANKAFTDLYALRTYYKTDGSIESLLDQPSRFEGEGRNHSLRTGADYNLNRKTTLGMVLTGVHFTRRGSGNNTAVWKNETGLTDSVISTGNSSRNKFKNGGINLNLRHQFDARHELSADIDFVTYDIFTFQAFQNNLLAQGGYEEAFKGDLPSQIDIFSGKADYVARFRDNLKFEAGLKSSRINTDNIAAYFYKDGGNWREDLGKTNHFLYTENIHAAYASLEKKKDRLTMQAGLRYEFTDYKANQLGNSIQKDSAFSRNYSSFFPSASINFEVDSLHQVMFSAGRRIDRPAFQILNPFLYIVNKYTYQRGNSLILPQYTWNLELSHVFKNMITTTLGYNHTNDYFSQLFLSNPDGTVIYTHGNFKGLQNVSASVSVNVSPVKWWTVTGMALYNHKRIEGVLWKDYVATIDQMNFNINNQFRFGKNWSAELSGYYVTKHQNDIQEVLEPTGQLSAGFSKQILKNKATIRLNVRDIFYTQAMAGMTYFENSDEYFKLKRDSRVATISFTYRFGKNFKTVARRSSGATDEMQRVGTGN